MVSEDRRRELGRFLRDRRARLQPQAVGLPVTPRRRVRGLRREEVAALAGVGVTWYTMLEAGTASGVSDATLDAIAVALQLSPDETAYLHVLADATASRPPLEAVEPVVARAVAAIAWAPAYVATTQWNVLLWNEAMSLVWGIEPPGGAPFNIVRRMFGDPKIRALHGERFPAFARAVVAMYRSGHALRMDDPVYRALKAELSRDPVFTAAWEAYDVAVPRSSVRTEIFSPNVGLFSYEALTLTLDASWGHAVVVQVPDVGSGERLRAALATQSTVHTESSPASSTT